MSNRTPGPFPDREGPPDDRADAALREGLRALVAPAASPDFDARVLGALRRPASWRQTLGETLRPALAGAACSLVATLALILWSSRLPVQTRPSAPSPAAGGSLALDQALDRPDLRAASLAGPALLRLLAPPAPRAEDGAKAGHLGGGQTRRPGEGVGSPAGGTRRAS